MPAPDLFTNVHKGIRRALFEACVALGRAGDDEGRAAAARGLLRDALRFTAHHGENEDLLLLPLLEGRAPALLERLTEEHARVEAPLRALIARVDDAPVAALYEEACAFTARYLDHLRAEEALEAELRAALTVDELVGFGKRSVERTAPADQRMMLGFMLPAMTGADVEGFLARVPPAVAEALRPLAG